MWASIGTWVQYWPDLRCKRTRWKSVLLLVCIHFESHQFPSLLLWRFPEKQFLNKGHLCVGHWPRYKGFWMNDRVFSMQRKCTCSHKWKNKTKQRQSQATRQILPSGIKKKYLSAAFFRSKSAKQQWKLQNFCTENPSVAPQSRETYDSYDIIMLKLELREHGRNDVTVAARAASEALFPLRFWKSYVQVLNYLFSGNFFRQNLWRWEDLDCSFIL